MSAAPMPVSWAGLEEIPIPTAPYSPSLTAPKPEPIPSTTPTLQNTGVVSREGINRVARLKELERSDPELHRLYEAQIAPHLAGNKPLPEIVAYLFRAVSGVAAERLMTLTLDLNPDVYIGPMETHMTELKNNWKARLDAYPQTLSNEEREAYEPLDDDEKAAFRIMRDLAMQQGGQFFLSTDELQRRLGGNNGWRMRNNFAGSYRIIQMVQPGVLRAKGVRGVAGYFKWRLPLPQAVQPQS